LVEAQRQRHGIFVGGVVEDQRVEETIPVVGKGENGDNAEGGRTIGGSRRNLVFRADRD